MKTSSLLLIKFAILLTASLVLSDQVEEDSPVVNARHPKNVLPDETGKKQEETGANFFLQNFFSNIGASLEQLFVSPTLTKEDRGDQKQQDKQKVGKVYEDEDEDYFNAPEVKFPVCESAAASCTPRGEKVACGEPARSGRIVNGTETVPGAYPWAVGIQFGEKLYCGGSLITDIFVITAAHCLKGINYSKIKLILGDHDRRRKGDNKITRLVDSAFLRPDFEKKTFNNDIALIRLNEPVEFSPFIRPVCLPTFDRSYNGHTTTVVGWGKLSEGGSPADVLQEVVVPIIPQKKCRHETRYRSKEITENMFCAGYDQGVLDACQGDSGGPMVWRGEDNNAFIQIGIVSWGQGCARSGYPGVYTRIGRYLEWISDIIEKNKSCLCV